MVVSAGHEHVVSEKGIVVELFIGVFWALDESGTLVTASDDSGLFCFDLSKVPRPASDLPRRNE